MCLMQGLAGCPPPGAFILTYSLALAADQDTVVHRHRNYLQEMRAPPQEAEEQATSWS